MKNFEKNKKILKKVLIIFFVFDNIKNVEGQIENLIWGISSAGRAPALHAGGQEFESPILQNKKDTVKGVFFIILLRKCFIYSSPTLTFLNSLVTINYMLS